MKKLVLIMFVSICFVSCGPSAEELEKQRKEDSVKAENDRAKAIEDADKFILNQDSTQKK